MKREPKKAEPMTNEREAEIIEAFANLYGYEDMKSLVNRIMVDAAERLMFGSEAFGRRILAGLHPYIDALILASGDEDAEVGEFSSLLAMETYVKANTLNSECGKCGCGKRMKNMYDIGHEAKLEPDEPKAVLDCDVCGAPIFEGDGYFSTPWGDVCADCMDGYEKTAERERD